MNRVELKKKSQSTKHTYSTSFDAKSKSVYDWMAANNSIVNGIQNGKPIFLLCCVLLFSFLVDNGTGACQHKNKRITANENVREKENDIG